MLSYLQRHESHHGEHDGYQREAHHYLRFRNGLYGALYDGVDACIAGFLEVVVQWCHLEDALTHAEAFFCVFEVSHLQHHR